MKIWARVWRHQDNSRNEQQQNVKMQHSLKWAKLTVWHDETRECWHTDWRVSVVSSVFGSAQRRLELRYSREWPRDWTQWPCAQADWLSSAAWSWHFTSTKHYPNSPCARRRPTVGRQWKSWAFHRAWFFGVGVFRGLGVQTTCLQRSFF